jgi:hypothetical protein
MNRLLDRKIADTRSAVVNRLEYERCILLSILSEVAQGKSIDLAEYAECAARLHQHMAAYNALVALRTELGE